MDVWVVGVPMLGGDPIELGPKVSLRVGKKIAGERLEVDHLGCRLRADDEPEVMAVVPAAFRKAFVVGGVALGIEHPRFLAIAGHFLAFEVSHVRGKRGRAECPAAMANDAGPDHDAAGRTK